MEPAKASTCVPEEFTCVGQPDLGNISLRLHSMAAFLAAQGLQEAAEFCTKAMGVIRAKLAATMAVPIPKAVATTKAA
jgi:hypothetical protein